MREETLTSISSGNPEIELSFWVEMVRAEVDGKKLGFDHSLWYTEDLEREGSS